MNPQPLAAKGVSRSGRIKNARLFLLPGCRRLAYEDRVRAARGFLSNAEIRAKMWGDVE